MSISSRLAHRLVAAVPLVLAAAVTLTGTLAAQPAPRPQVATQVARVADKLPTPSDDWLKGLTSRHRQFFDSPSPAGGIPLVHIMNYYDTLNRAYHTKDAAIDAVGTFYGATTFYGVDDAMWAKYQLGEFLETADPATSKPAVANPWRAAPIILGMSLPQASIETLQKRGATFILCDNALHIFAGLLAQKRGLSADAVYADLATHILPGVNLVPGMVVAIDQAYAAGLSYHRQ